MQTYPVLKNEMKCNAMQYETSVYKLHISEANQMPHTHIYTTVYSRRNLLISFI